MPILVGKAARSTLPVELNAIGTGQASETVSVQSQVAGIVKEVNYRAGQAVHKGDLLVSLDESPFLAALAQAQATLTRDKAQAQLNATELKRYNELLQAGVVPQRAIRAASSDVIRLECHRRRRRSRHSNGQN